MNSYLKHSSGKLPEGTNAAGVGWRAPSNIALVKYWGKHGRQLPANPSLSITLSEAYTDTRINYKPKEKNDKGIDVSLLFEGVSNDLFESKIRKFMGSIIDVFPFLPTLSFEIDSANSFPHSSGIASSASSMAALALCLCSIERSIYNPEISELDFLKKASYVARLGSGSAARSLYPGMTVWGQHAAVTGSSDDYAIEVNEKIHPVYKGMCDSILIVHAGEKKVSSRAGHALMEGHPMSAIRYQQAVNNLENLLIVLENGDLEEFGKIVEEEALSLHALMMTSDPSFILMKPNTLEIISRIRDFRTETGLPIYFTLDAGPNVHIIYPEANKEEIDTFIQSLLLDLCQDRRWIRDKMGNGPNIL